MPDMWMDVDVALSEVPVNLLPLLDATDFKTIEDAIAYNAAGLALFWHFVTTAGAYTVTAVTPTTGGAYDWTDQGTSGIYTIEIPASGGASINNDTEGFGWFTGSATGVLPWRGPVIGFRHADNNDLFIDDPVAAEDGSSFTNIPKEGYKLAADGVDLVTKLKAMLDATTSSAVNDAAATTSAFVTDLTEATDDHYNGSFLVFTSGALAGQARQVSDYAGDTKTVTLSTALTEAPADNDTFIILGRSA